MKLLIERTKNGIIKYDVCAGPATNTGCAPMSPTGIVRTWFSHTTGYEAVIITHCMLKPPSYVGASCVEKLRQFRIITDPPKEYKNDSFL